MPVTLVRTCRALGAITLGVALLGVTPAGAVDVEIPVVGDQGGRGIELPDLPVESPPVDEVNDAIKDVTGDLGLGGQEPDPPADSGTTPSEPNPGPADEPAPEPAPPGGGTSGPEPAPPASDASNTTGDGNGSADAGSATAGASQAQAATPNRDRADRGAQPSDSGGDEAAGTPVQRLFQEVVELPSLLLVAILGLALLGLGMVVRSSVLAINTRRLRARQVELNADVGALQSALMPVLPERIGDVAISAAYRPFDGPAAGGDFIDVMPLDDRRFGIVVGDVSGHDRDALAATGLVHYTVRAYLEAGLEPRDALRLTDQALGKKLDSNYATVLAAIYELDTGTLLYATAGHPSPIVVGADEDRPVYALTPPPIGLGPVSGYRQTRIGIPPDSRICLYTDGLVDAMGDDGARVGRERVLRMAEGLGDEASAERLLETVLDGSEPRDDMTACVLAPAARTGASFVVEEIDLGPADSALRGLDQFLAGHGLADEEIARVHAAIEIDPGTSDRRLRVHRVADEVTWTIESPAADGDRGDGGEYIPLFAGVGASAAMRGRSVVSR